MNDDKQSIVRTILRHELTWIIMVLSFGWAFVSQVILPIQKLSLDLASVRAEVAKITNDHDDVVRIKTDVQNIEAQLTANQAQHQKLEDKLNKLK
jgi:hypothetical protein